MIRFAIVGYGNLGKACEKIAADSGKFDLVGIFTRRDPASMSSPFGTPFFRQDDIESFKGKIDVLARARRTTLPNWASVAPPLSTPSTVSTLTPVCATM